MNFLVGDLNRMDKRQVRKPIETPLPNQCAPPFFLDVLPVAKLWDDRVVCPDDMEGANGVHRK